MPYDVSIVACPDYEPATARIMPAIFIVAIDWLCLLSNWRRVLTLMLKQANFTAKVCNLY